MSAATATLIAGGLAILGALLGAVVGKVVVEDRLRRRGEVRVDVKAWSGGSTGGLNSEGRSFELRVFNDRDVNVSLWDPKVEFYKDGTLVEPPVVPTTQHMGGTEVGPIDLSSRKTVIVSMSLAADGELLAQLKQADRVRFVATVVPRSGQLSEALPSWDPVEPLGSWSSVR